ncbi:MAG: hypothetical protein DMG36_01655 [Acidobacteria bacterium]|nr:MAG: hypothetical protein DMG36_01655 [Acidobacteriota bacterium]
MHVSSRGVSALRHSELQELGLLSHLHYDPPAMRRTLLHSPADLVHYKHNLHSAIETARPIVDEATQSYDEMIRQLRESEGWRN